MFPPSPAPFGTLAQGSSQQQRPTSQNQHRRGHHQQKQKQKQKQQQQHQHQHQHQQNRQRGGNHRQQQGAGGGARVAKQNNFSGGQCQASSKAAVPKPGPSSTCSEPRAKKPRSIPNALGIGGSDSDSDSDSDSEIDNKKQPGQAADMAGGEQRGQQRKRVWKYDPKEIQEWRAARRRSVLFLCLCLAASCTQMHTPMTFPPLDTSTSMSNLPPLSLSASYSQTHTHTLSLDLSLSQST